VRVVVYRSNVDGDWRFRVVGDNGETVSQSEGYRRRVDAISTAHKIAPEGALVEVTD
jgi:uncharacterized protein YegP (UPF0339 family)